MYEENILIKERDKLFRAIIDGFELNLNLDNQTISSGKFIASLNNAGIKFIANKLKSL